MLLESRETIYWNIDQGYPTCYTRKEQFTEGISNMLHQKAEEPVVNPQSLTTPDRIEISQHTSLESRGAPVANPQSLDGYLPEYRLAKMLHQKAEELQQQTLPHTNLLEYTLGISNTLHQKAAQQVNIDQGNPIHFTRKQKSTNCKTHQVICWNEEWEV